MLKSMITGAKVPAPACVVEAYADKLADYAKPPAPGSFIDCNARVG
jgi:hypothetical protein